MQIHLIYPHCTSISIRIHACVYPFKQTKQQTNIHTYIIHTRTYNNQSHHRSTLPADTLYYDICDLCELCDHRNGIPSLALIGILLAYECAPFSSFGRHLTPNVCQMFVLLYYGFPLILNYRLYLCMLVVFVVVVYVVCMYMYVCMYVCMYVYVCVYVCMYVLNLYVMCRLQRIVEHHNNGTTKQC